MPASGLGSCQSTSSSSRHVLDSLQAQTAAPLPAASGAADVTELCDSAPQLVQTQAQPQPVFTGPLKASPPPPPPPPPPLSPPLPPPQSRLHCHLQGPSGLPPSPQTCLAAADPALPPAFMAAQAIPAMSAHALSVMSPVAPLPLLQDSSAQTPPSQSNATMPAATAGSYAAGHGVPAPQAMEDVLAAESTLSAATALAVLAQPVSCATTAALAADSRSLSALQPGLPLTGNSRSATCGMSTLSLTAEPVATALPIRAALPALADPSLMGVPPHSPGAVASVNPVVTATAATVALSALAGQSSAGTAVLPEAVVSMMANATAGIQAATAALSATAHEHRGQVTGADLLYDHLASVLGTAPATCDRALTFLPPCHSNGTLESEHSGMLKPHWTYVAGKRCAQSNSCCKACS